ncbi:hypothetical protein PsorP6_012214 [Peronosclerospora sorghi]|uniref:Uncharacterized protein n=1 Tax=Peronosclerospora sorghi TaxID=230839 RepID=A0ACC0WI51_9STRA|nr:hypothetical protein PsorP6_012214 [Peronosclerospora sorghi]
MDAMLPTCLHQEVVFVDMANVDTRPSEILFTIGIYATYFFHTREINATTVMPSPPLTLSKSRADDFYSICWVTNSLTTRFVA